MILHDARHTSFDRRGIFVRAYVLRRTSLVRREAPMVELQDRGGPVFAAFVAAGAGATVGGEL
jgi:hypothetical protein